MINLAADKLTVLREAARMLRPGGLFAVSDVIADPDMDAATRADMQQWTGCVAGALTRAEFELALHDAGLVEVEIAETHRVHTHAAAAIVRAHKSTSDTAAATLDGCCTAAEQQTCCAATDKAACCGASTAGGCGCR